MKIISIILLYFLVNFKLVAQDIFLPKFDSAFKKLELNLSANNTFKESVEVVENCYSIFNKKIDNEIEVLVGILRNNLRKATTRNYVFPDSLNYLKSYQISNLFINKIYLHNDSTIFVHRPFTYNHLDPFGTQDFTNTFVTKLLQTHQGNCRSLAYLYKILADELGAKCWLSIAPNHIYIKNYSQKIGWYNTELTNGTFPTDAWIMTTGYVNPEAIKSGLYMDTLSNQQAIALCVLDLAKGYERQTKNYHDGFILKCCELVLHYHPVNAMALLLKTETLKKVYLHEKEIHFPKPTVTESQMTEAYITLAKLGYREMSDRMFQKWLESINEQKEKYSNEKVAKPSLKK